MATSKATFDRLFLVDLLQRRRIISRNVIINRLYVVFLQVSPQSKPLLRYLVVLLQVALTPYDPTHFV
jgi:hypothetical protein